MSKRRYAARGSCKSKEKNSEAKSALVVLFALIVALSCPRRAQAQEFQTHAGGGAFIGYAFGSVQGFEWGLEAFDMAYVEGNGWNTRTGFGPLFQAAFLGRDARLTVAVHGGTQFEGEAPGALTGELGITHRFGSSPGWGMHVGFTPEWLYVNASLRGQFFLGSAAFNFGVRPFLTYGRSGSSAE